MLNTVLQEGGWPAGPQFTIALQIEVGARVVLTINSAMSGELRHGTSVAAVVPGVSRVSFSALPSADALLAFFWSCEARVNAAPIVVIAAEQDSE